MPRFVFHLDADCFYCSCERVRFKWMQGKPLGVLGNQGVAVIAKSYELKRAGIKTGEAIWEARRKCPDSIFVKRDFRWYEVLSKQMLEIVKQHSPEVEFYSIDEFFFAYDGGDPEGFARRIQQQILRSTGLPVTIGAARSRTQAKLVSDTGKPFGVAVITDPDRMTELLGKLSVNEITGVGGRRAATLNAYGIYTCLDFVRADRNLILKLLTKVGEGLWYELRGEPVVRINTTRAPHKNISRGGSLAGRVASFPVLHGWLVRNVERLVEELHWHEVHAGKLTVFLSYTDDCPSLGAQAPLSAPTDRFESLLESAEVGMERAWRQGWTATHMHLIAGDLRREGCRCRSLFEDQSSDTIVAETKRKINDRIGRFAIRSGSTLFLKGIYDDGTNSYDICDVRGKTCF